MYKVHNASFKSVVIMGIKKERVKTGESAKIKIIIADTQYLVVNSLASLIRSDDNYSLCGIAESRLALLNLLSLHTPDLLITDIHLIDYDGVDDFPEILQTYNKLSVLILVNQVSLNEITKLAREGVKNIALKTDTREDLLTSIAMAAKKKKHLSDPVLDMILEQEEAGNTNAGTGLTHSETEIVRMISDGYTTKEIAAKKHISIHTVMTHRKNIFRKLDVSSISELTKYAIRNGLTDITDYSI